MTISYADGIDVVFNNMDRHAAEQDALIDQAVQGAGILCQALAKQKCPVKTGRLRASIQYLRVGPKECRVKTNVSYSISVELGHVTRGGKLIGPRKFVAARPYLYPAYQAAYRSLLEELKSIGA